MSELDSPRTQWVNSMLLPHITTDTELPEHSNMSGSTSAPPTTTSFDMLSSMSDSSDAFPFMAHDLGHIPVSATSAPGSVQQGYLALPFAPPPRPGHTRRHSNVQSQEPRYTMPQLTRTVSLGQTSTHGGLMPALPGLGDPSPPAPFQSSHPDDFDAAAAMHNGHITPDGHVDTSYFPSTTLTDSQHKPPRGPNLKRGKACSFCRQRKLRCSGQTPKCSSCIKFKRDPCEYKAHSRAQSFTSVTEALKSPGSETSLVFDSIEYPYFSPPLPDSHDQLAPQVLYDQNGVISAIPPMAQQLLNTPHDLFYGTPFTDGSTWHGKTGSISSGMSALCIPPHPHSGPSTTTSTGTSNSASNGYQHRHRIDSDDPPPPGSQLPLVSDGPLYECPPPPSDVLFASDARYTDPVQPLTRRLGEFLFFPVNEVDKGTCGEEADPQSESADGERLVGQLQADDGLTDAERQAMFDTFFPYSRLFFQMSIARFKYRMQFKDERRPSPAFLNAIYLWATRFTDQEHLVQDKLELEEKYFEAGRAAIFDQSTLPYRMLDQMRAGFLLSAYLYGGGRFHEGWMLHGIATRLATSTGLHHIGSCTFGIPEPSESRDPFIRQKRYLLPPPEDRLELAERIHTFWAVFSLDRLATCLTGFPTTIPDEDITTPLPKDFDEIANGHVSVRDDYTIADMYRDKLPPERQTQYCHWLKVSILLERVSKMAFLEPESDSLYAQYQSGATPYFADLEQARYRRPQEYTMLLAAITRLTTSMGADGVLPTVRLAGDGEVMVPNLVIIIHHIRWVTLTLLHDVDHADSPNTDALLYARQSIIMIRKMPQMVWGVIARVLVKEIRRLTRLGEEEAAEVVVKEVQVLLHEIKRVGVTMVVARATAQMIEDSLQSTGLTV